MNYINKTNDIHIALLVVVYDQMQLVLQLIRKVQFLFANATMLIHKDPFLHNDEDHNDELYQNTLQPTEFTLFNTLLL